MITFLPSRSFKESAEILDYKRLGKQRVEAKLILEILIDIKYNGESKSKWRNHPAVKIWEGFETDLSVYGMFMCNEWLFRGYEDNLFSWFKVVYTMLAPQWPGQIKFSKALHTSHRAALKAKDPKYYKKFGWKEKPKIEYIWR